MKTLKIMSIIGLAWAVRCWFWMITFNTNDLGDMEAALGWGMCAIFYLIAFSIVVLVKAKK